MSEEHIESLIKTMEISNTNTKKVGVAGDMDDFWDDCLDSKNHNQRNNNNKNQNNLSKKFNKINNENEEDLPPEDYITCN